MINDFFDDKMIAIFFDDESKLAIGFDRGSIEGYSALEFELMSQPTITGFARDRQTGSVWNILGKAVAGVLVGKQLHQLEKAYGGFWFAWASYFEPIEIYSPTTDVDDNDPILSLPQSYGLEQNFPNPFNPVTTIRYYFPQSEEVTINIYNLNGQLIRNLVSEKKNAGFHEIVWDARDSEGKILSSGVYLYGIQAGVFTELKKLTLLK